MQEDQIKNHPSYGMLEINRVSCSPSKPLFGSSILHNNTIELTIKKAEVDRHLNRDWFYGRENVVTVEMSYSQFTQAIMSLNTSGTPVTIKNISNQPVEQETVLHSKKDLFEKEFQNTINRIFDSSTEAVLLATDYVQQTKPLSKTQKQDLYNLLYRINQDLKENLKFVVSSFKSQMDKTITESHGEIEAFFNMKIQSLGLDALQNETKLIGESNGDT